MPQPTPRTSFFNNLKRSIALVLLVGLMAPALSLSVTPPQQVQAQSITAAVVTSAVCMATQLFSLFGSGLRGVMENIFGGATSVLSVPVNETNSTIISSLRGIQGNTGEASRSAFMLVVKECILDVIVWYLKEVMVTQLTQTILGSISEGFFEGPMFEIDPIRFFKGVADASFNTFLFETEVLGQVLPSLQERVATALAIDYNTESYSSGGGGVESATLSPVDYELLFAGNIMETEGGLLTLLEFTEDRNNPMGSYIGMVSETGARMNRVMGQESTLLSYGDGWHSKRCDFGTVDEPLWQVCTPGTWIAQQMDDWSNSSLKQLQVADEFSEIMQALLAALVSEIINNEATGLLESLPREYWGGATRESATPTGAEGDYTRDTVGDAAGDFDDFVDDTELTDGDGDTGDDVPAGE